MCQRMGARIVWAMSNFMVFACMAGTAIISLVSVRGYSEGVQHIVGANGAAKIASLVVFGLLGLPLAVSAVVLNPSSFFLFIFEYPCFHLKYNLLDKGGLLHCPYLIPALKTFQFLLY